MIVKVHMFAFTDSRNVIREVEIDDVYKRAAVMKILNKVFEMGQNDFQPKPVPSVSVGDVIELEVGEFRRQKYWVVDPIGFTALTQEEFDVLVPPTGWTRYKNS